MSKRSARKGREADDSILRELDDLREKNSYKSNLIGVGVMVLLVAFLLTSGMSCAASSAGSNTQNVAQEEVATTPLTEVNGQISQWKDSLASEPESVEALSNLAFFEVQKVQLLDAMMQRNKDVIAELEGQQLNAGDTDEQQDGDEENSAEEVVDLKELETNLVTLQTENTELEADRVAVLEDAKTHFEKALSQDPSYGFALKSKADFLMYLKDYDQAKKVVLALRAAGEQPVAEDEQYPEAVKAERLSMQTEAYLSLAHLASVNEQPAIMLKHLETAKSLSPGDFRAYAGLVQGYIVAGKREKAMENYKHLKGIAFNSGDQQAQQIAQFIGIQTGLEEELNPSPPEETTTKVDLEVTNS